MTDQRADEADDVPSTGAASEPFSLADHAALIDDAMNRLRKRLQSGGCRTMTVVEALDSIAPELPPPPNYVELFAKLWGSCPPADDEPVSAWTSAPPSWPGWHWWRVDEESARVPAWVDAPSVMTGVQYAKLWNERGCVDVGELGGEWQPIEPARP